MASARCMYIHTHKTCTLSVCVRNICIFSTNVVKQI